LNVVQGQKNVPKFLLAVTLGFSFQYVKVELYSLTDQHFAFFPSQLFRDCVQLRGKFEEIMKTIVSVTPIAVASDSRTYKIAASFARFGFNSIVVEGQKSNLENRLPFTLLGVKGWLISTSARDMGDSNHSPVSFLQNWLMRLFKPFLNQMRTFLSLPLASFYYLHSFYQFPAVFFKAKLLGVPYVYDAHDFYRADDPGRLNRWLERMCIRYAAYVVTVSPGIASLFHNEFGCVPVVVRNCHDSRLDQSAKTLRESLNLSVKDFIVLVIGQAKAGMPVLEAIQAFNDLPSTVHLVFLGENVQNYQGVVEKAGLTTRVHLLPPVSPAQVVPFISTADVSLILYYSHTENFEYSLPNKFFQSISAHLPLLFPPLTEIKRLAERYRLGITIDTTSPESIRKGILKFMENRELLAQYKENLVVASQELSWEQEEKILLDLANDILATLKGKI